MSRNRIGKNKKRNLCRDYAKLDKASKKTLLSIAMKFDYDPFSGESVEEHLEDYMERSNVAEVQRRITQDIVPKYKEYLMRDITSHYESVSGEIRTFFQETKANNEEILRTSRKSADEIRASYEKSKKDLDEVQSYRQQLELALKAVKANTEERVEQLCKAIREMASKA